MEHAHKAVTLSGVIKVLHATGALERVLDRVSPETKAALLEPQSRRYHPGGVLDETFTVLAELHGPEAVERVMALATEASLKGVVGPLARLFMTMMGGGPRPLLERFETLISGGTQGFTARWEPTGECEGTLVIGSDDVLPPIADHAWKGAVEYLLAFAEVKGAVAITERAPASRVLRLAVKWG